LLCGVLRRPTGELCGGILPGVDNKRENIVIRGMTAVGLGNSCVRFATVFGCNLIAQFFSSKGEFPDRFRNFTTSQRVTYRPFSFAFFSAVAWACIFAFVLTTLASFALASSSASVWQPQLPSLWFPVIVFLSFCFSCSAVDCPCMCPF
jgi:hypothetical protein